MTDLIANLEGCDYGDLLWNLDTELPDEGTLTFLDDDPSGDPERIDAGHEALSLARYLYSTYDSYHTEENYISIMENDLRNLEKRQGGVNILLGYSTKSGKGLLEDSRFQLATQGDLGHFKINQRNIEKAANVFLKEWRERAVPRRPTVMVLGAGGCNDIPLKYLAERFKVILVDTDKDSMMAALKSLPKSLQKNVELKVRDLSGGIVEELMFEGSEIVINSSIASEGINKLAKLYAGNKRPRTPILEGDDKVDLMISSLLISQISAYPLNLVRSLLRSVHPGETFIVMPGSPFYDAEIDLAADIYERHIEAFGRLCKTFGRSCILFQRY